MPGKSRQDQVLNWFWTSTLAGSCLLWLPLACFCLLLLALACFGCFDCLRFPLNIDAKLTKIRTNIDEKSSKIRTKSQKKAKKCPRAQERHKGRGTPLSPDLGAVLGRSWDALGTPWARPRPSKTQPRAPNFEPEAFFCTFFGIFFPYRFWHPFLEPKTLQKLVPKP